MSLRRPALALVILLASAACADGPSAPNAPAPDAATLAKRVKPAPTPSPTPAPTPAPSTGTTVTGCDGSSVALSAEEASSLALHNQQRASSGLAAFCVHPTLQAAARAHSQDMVARSYFTHSSLDGTTFDTRIVRAGYTGWTLLAENIAWGSGAQGAPAAIFTAWMNSPAHRDNILNGGLREIGIGVASGTFQGYMGALVYTADFGAR